MLVVGFADVVYSVPVTFTSSQPNGTRNRISCASSSSSAEILKTLVPLWVPVNVITTNEPNASRVNWLLAATRPRRGVAAQLGEHVAEHERRSGLPHRAGRAYRADQRTAVRDAAVVRARVAGRQVLTRDQIHARRVAGEPTPDAERGDRRVAADAEPSLDLGVARAMVAEHEDAERGRDALRVQRAAIRLRTHGPRVAAARSRRQRHGGRQERRCDKPRPHPLRTVRGAPAPVNLDQPPCPTRSSSSRPGTRPVAARAAGRGQARRCPTPTCW